MEKEIKRGRDREGDIGGEAETEREKGIDRGSEMENERERDGEIEG